MCEIFSVQLEKNLLQNVQFFRVDFHVLARAFFFFGSVRELISAVQRLHTEHGCYIG